MTINGYALGALRVLTGTTRNALAEELKLNSSTLYRLEHGYHSRVRADTFVSLTQWLTSHGIDRRAVLAHPDDERPVTEAA